MRLLVRVQVSPAVMPLVLSFKRYDGGCPGNWRMPAVVSSCRLPRTKSRCFEVAYQSRRAMVVFKLTGEGEENEYEPRFKPSPKAEPLAVGNWLNVCSMYGSSPGPQGQVPLAEQL